jgi:hypothetical protein
MDKEQLAKKIVSKLKKESSIVKEVPADAEGNIYDHEVFKDGWLYPDQMESPELIEELFPNEVKGLPEEVDNENSNQEESDLEEDLPNQGYSADGDDLYVGSGGGKEL